MTFGRKESPDREFAIERDAAVVIASPFSGRAGRGIDPFDLQEGEP